MNIQAEFDFVNQQTDAERFKQGFQFLKHGILAFAKHIGQNSIGGQVNGVPEPTLVDFVADKRPIACIYKLDPLPTTGNGYRHRKQIAKHPLRHGTTVTCHVTSPPCR